MIEYIQNKGTTASETAPKLKKQYKEITYGHVQKPFRLRLQRKLEGVEKYLAWGKYCQYLEESNAREDVELPFQDEYDDEYDCDDYDYDCDCDCDCDCDDEYGCDDEY